MGRAKFIHQNQYIISNNGAKHLMDLGFKYDNDKDKYAYMFPVLKHEKMMVLRGRVTAYTDTN